jgi:hypothetical protein
VKGDRSILIATGRYLGSHIFRVEPQEFFVWAFVGVCASAAVACVAQGGGGAYGAYGGANG